jgi:hypothetical protein
MKHLAAFMLLAGASVQAHITLDRSEAPAGSSYRAVFKGRMALGRTAQRRQPAARTPAVRLKVVPARTEGHAH